jgi:putative lipoic acid-binding regulatory protein
MSEELQSLVQIIELYGKGLGKALRFSAKGAAKGVQIAYNPENVENVRMVIDY